MSKINLDSEQYKVLISENNIMINEYRRLANELEKQNETYNDILQSMNVNKEIAENEVREVIGTLVGRKVY